MERKSIDYFMKNQRDLLYGDESRILKGIPKLFFKVFEKIISIRNSEITSIEQIYYSILDSESWDNDHERLLAELKKSINSNKWECLDPIENVSIIIQLLLDWLEDCVFFILPPEKIKEILETDNILQRSEKIANNGNSTEDVKDAREITKFLRSKLRSIEFDTLLYFAKVSNDLYPENGDYLNNFLAIIDKLSQHMLGYRDDEINNNIDAAKIEEISFNVRGMSNLVFVLAITLQYDEDDASFYNHNNASFKIGSVINERDHSVHLKTVNSHGMPKISKFSDSNSIYRRPHHSKSTSSEHKKLSEASDYLDFSSQAGANFLNNIQTINKLNPEERDKSLFMLYRGLSSYFGRESGASSSNALKKGIRKLNSDNSELSDLSVPNTTMKSRLSFLKPMYNGNYEENDPIMRDDLANLAASLKKKPNGGEQTSPEIDSETSAIKAARKYSYIYLSPNPIEEEPDIINNESLNRLSRSTDINKKEEISPKLTLKANHPNRLLTIKDADAINSDHLKFLAGDLNFKPSKKLSHADLEKAILEYQPKNKSSLRNNDNSRSVITISSEDSESINEKSSKYIEVPKRNSNVEKRNTNENIGKSITLGLGKNSAYMFRKSIRSSTMMSKPGPINPEILKFHKRNTESVSKVENIFRQSKFRENNAAS